MSRGFPSAFLFQEMKGSVLYEKKDKYNENRSVLNTDAFDKRRFNEIYEMSQGLQKISDEGELPTFEPLLATFGLPYIR